MAFLLSLSFSGLNPLRLIVVVVFFIPWARVHGVPLALPVPSSGLDIDLAISDLASLPPVSSPSLSTSISSPVIQTNTVTLLDSVTIIDVHLPAATTSANANADSKAVFEALDSEDVQTNYRSVWDLVYACLGTIIACTWVAMHPNVRGYYDTAAATTSPNDKPDDGEFDRLVQKTELMLWAIIAPEVVVVWAFRQWAGAREIQRLIEERMQTLRENEPTAQFVPWTLTHSHFLQMGGYIFRKKEEITYVNLPPVPLSVALAWSEVNFDGVGVDADGVPILGELDRRAQYLRGLVEENRESHQALDALVQSHLFREPSNVSDANSIVSATTTTTLLAQEAQTEADIEDRSKADGLGKAIAIVQTLWFVAQCIGRKAQGLHVTELEATTLGYAVLNGVMYWLWWHKPVDVVCPVVVDIDTGHRGEEGPTTMVEMQPMGAQAAAPLPEETRTPEADTASSDVEASSEIQPQSQESQQEEKKADEREPTGPTQMQETHIAAGPESSQAPLTWYGNLGERILNWLEPVRFVLASLDRYIFLTVLRYNPKLWNVYNDMRTGTTWSLIMKRLLIGLFIFTPIALPRIFLRRLKEIAESNLRRLRFVDTWDGTVYPLTNAFPPLRFPTFAAHRPGKALERTRLYFVFFVGPFLGVVVGAVHCAKWSDAFPSATHAAVWRAASVFLAAAPVFVPGVMVLAMVLRALEAFVDWVRSFRPSPSGGAGGDDEDQWRSRMKQVEDTIIDQVNAVVVPPVLLLYVPARLVLIVLSFVELRALPDSAKIDVDFEGYLPHF